MPRSYRVLIGLSLFLLTASVAAPVSATAMDSVNSNEFWSRLQQTAVLLDSGIGDAGDPGPFLTQIGDLWQGVDAVQFPGGEVVSLDLSWLTARLPDASLDEMVTLRREVQGLLKYHDTHPDNPQQLLSALAALDEVLQDARFHYAPTPTPQIPPTRVPPNQQQEQPAQDTQLLSPELAQALLIIVGAIVVGLLLLGFARNLRIQQRRLPDPLPEDEPTTSQDARERADDSQAAQDYRTAMRYLYLASLLLLDERGVLHYDRALTNREHLRQVADQPALSDALRPVVNTYDRVWYGFAPVSEPMFELFRQNVERLRQITP